MWKNSTARQPNKRAVTAELTKLTESVPVLTAGFIWQHVNQNAVLVLLRSCNTMVCN